MSQKQWRASTKAVKSEFWKPPFAALFGLGWEGQKMEACFSLNFATSKFNRQSMSGKMSRVWFPVAFQVPQQDLGDLIALHWESQLLAAGMTTQAQNLGFNFAVLKFLHVSAEAPRIED